MYKFTHDTTVVRATNFGIGKGVTFEGWQKLSNDLGVRIMKICR